MTVEEIKSAIYVKVTGGEPSTEVSITLDDIHLLLAPAINLHILETYKANPDLSGINPLFTRIYDALAVTFDTVKNRYYVELPTKVISYPNGEGVLYVGKTYGHAFNRIKADDGSFNSFYWKTKRDITSYSIDGDRIYFYNYPSTEDPVMIKMIVGAGTLVDSDEISLPSEGELAVINMLVDFFKGQRDIPKDLIVDRKDRP